MIFNIGILFCLLCKLYQNSGDKHYQTSPRCSGLDLVLVKTALAKLATNTEVLLEVQQHLVKILASLRLFKQKCIIPCSRSNTDDTGNDFVLNDATGGEGRPRLSPALVESAAGRV